MSEDDVSVRIDGAGRTPPRIVRAETEPVLAAAREFLLWRTEADYGYGYEPQWHRDLGDMQHTYVDTEGQALWVALAPVTASSPRRGGEARMPGVVDEPLMDRDAAERVVGTVGIRRGGPLAPPHPPTLAARYADPDAVAQLVRLMVSPDHRRRGLASELTRLAVEFAREARYSCVYLHTNALVPGAVDFWRQQARQIYDARGTQYDADPRFATVHFEIPLR